MKRTLAVALALSLLTSLALLSGGAPASGGAAAGKPCGLTTLDGTIDVSVLEEGAVLKCGPGQPIKVRQRFVEGEAGRENRREKLLSFVSIADVQLADEESPLRAEWADKCEEHPATSAFRPHETMVPHLMNAHVRAADAIAKEGSPILDQKFNFAIGLGDLADNNQLNEIRWIVDIFDGDKIVNPDSGADSYDGVQVSVDGAPNADPLLASPVDGQSILELANEPFWAKGLKQGGPLPWYSVAGNHDLKVQGTVSNTSEWRQFADAWAQGGLKVQDLPPEKQQDACEGGPDSLFDPAVLDGTTKPVPADANRTILSREEWAQAHFETTGLPEGHGFEEGNRCTNKAGDEKLERLCYAWNQNGFRFIVLDTNPDEGLESGAVDRPQFAWLRRELRASSKRYFKPDGKEEIHKRGTNRLIVVFTHHTISSMDNEEAVFAGQKSGEDLKKLLLHYPNVIMHANGHTHQNKIWGRRNKKLGTAYWEVNTSAVADLPFQSRTVEVADNKDGTLSIFAVVFDALVPPNPRDIDWTLEDPTDETALAPGDENVEMAINENWLASAGREVGYYDPQQDLSKIGKAKDRNVELLLPAPAWLNNN
jgi:metallophosphoesterase (TIGR03767 family)